MILNKSKTIQNVATVFAAAIIVAINLFTLTTVWEIAETQTNSVLLFKGEFQPPAITSVPINGIAFDPACEGLDQEVCIFKIRALNEEEEGLIRNTLAACVHVLNSLDATTYFLNEKSLIGFFRHAQRMIPSVFI